jgi:hypothetical protein
MAPKIRKWQHPVEPRALQPIDSALTRMLFPPPSNKPGEMS